MSENSVNSDLWTGGTPPPPEQKPTSPFQYMFGGAIGAFGIPYGLRALFDGLTTGRLKVPLRGSLRFVTTDNLGLFAVCVVGWLTLIIFAGFLVHWSVKGLLSKPAR